MNLTLLSSPCNDRLYWLHIASGFGVAASIAVAVLLIPAVAGLIVLDSIRISTRSVRVIDIARTPLRPWPVPQSTNTRRRENKTANSDDVGIRKYMREAKSYAMAEIAANPNSAAWQTHIERGTEQEFDLIIVDSLAVLRAHSVTLAFSPVRPRGTVSTYNLGTRNASVETVPENNVVIREIVDQELPPDVETARRRAEERLEKRLRVFVFCPRSLFDALLGYTADALKRSNTDPKAVTSARVQLTAVQGRTFMVQLVSYSL